jgi:YD repeat-containing protein
MRVRAAILAAIVFLFVTPIFATGDDELFDASDRLIRSTDAEGVTSHYVYNEDGELIETRTSDGTVIIHEPDGAPEAE